MNIQKGRQGMITVSEMDDDIEEDLPPSKSQLKREAEAQVDLGKKLLALKSNELQLMPLTSELSTALQAAKKIRHHTARKRQMKLIGKILRSMDTETLSELVERLEKDDRARSQHFHQIEMWRDRLIAESDQGIQNFMQEYPQASRQQLREWVRQAHREAAQEKAPRASRFLFKYLRELMYQG